MKKAHAELAKAVNAAKQVVKLMGAAHVSKFEMERIDHVTTPLYPPPCQDREFSISRRLKDLEGEGLFWDKHIRVRHGFGGGTGLAALSLPQGLSLPVVAYIIKLFLPFPFA